MKENKARDMTIAIRPATEEDLQFLRHPPDPTAMAKLREAEIEEALTATSRPRHWRPVDVDPALLR